jgi:hypothetical protein
MFSMEEKAKDTGIRTSVGQWFHISTHTFSENTLFWSTKQQAAAHCVDTLLGKCYIPLIHTISETSLSYYILTLPNQLRTQLQVSCVSSCLSKPYTSSVTNHSTDCTSLTQLCWDLAGTGSGNFPHHGWSPYHGIRTPHTELCKITC